MEKKDWSGLCGLLAPIGKKTGMIAMTESNGEMVVKVVNEASDTTSEKHTDWKRAVRDLRIARCGREEDWNDSDQVESNGEMVDKVLNKTNDELNLDYRISVAAIQGTRDVYGRRWNDDRRAVETNGEMALYFVQIPNRKALEFHKAACMIWRMAGGAEPNDEYWFR